MDTYAFLEEINFMFLRILAYVDSPYTRLPLASIRRLLTVFNSLN
jgi:hypothetical protein